MTNEQILDLITKYSGRERIGRQCGGQLWNGFLGTSWNKLCEEYAVENVICDDLRNKLREDLESDR